MKDFCQPAGTVYECCRIGEYGSPGDETTGGVAVAVAGCAVAVELLAGAEVASGVRPGVAVATRSRVAVGCGTEVAGEAVLPAARVGVANDGVGRPKFGAVVAMPVVRVGSVSGDCVGGSCAPALAVQAAAVRATNSDIEAQRAVFIWLTTLNRFRRKGPVIASIQEQGCRPRLCARCAARVGLICRAWG